MATLLFVLIVISAAVVDVTVVGSLVDSVKDEEFECGFPWAVRDDVSGNCSCGNSLFQTLLCNYSRPTLAILDCTCISYDDKSNSTVVGYCPHNCANHSWPNLLINSMYHNIVHPFSYTARNFTKDVCGYLHRDGRFCGACEKDYYTPVYSYLLECITCKNEWYNWLIFAVEAFVPLSVFLIIVLIFRISATSAKLNAFVILSQNLAINPNIRAVLAVSNQKKTYKSLNIVKTVGAMYGIWNLDFFRTFLPPLCLHVTSLQVALLEYAIAFYPLVILVLGYLAVNLRISQRRWIALLCIPVNKHLTALQRMYGVKTSIIDAFATFLLLSYSRLLSVSFNLLMFTRAYSPRDKEMGKYLYMDGTIEYFGEQHRPYALTAIGILLVFVALPLILLLLYPTRCFHKCLTHLSLNSDLLRTFMDSFQGCYKDGTNGTHDCRFFASVYLIARIVFFIAYSLTLTELFYGAATIILIILAMVIVFVQPYKERYAVFNKVDAILILLQAMWCASILAINFALIKGRRFLMFSFVMCGVSGSLPLLYFLAITLHWIYTQSCFTPIKARLKTKFSVKVAKCEYDSDIDEEDRQLLGSTPGHPLSTSISTSYRSIN